MNIRELALVDISAPLWRIGRSPEKLQIFLCYSPLPFCPVRELKSLTIVPHYQGRELIPAEFKDVGVLLLSPWGRLGWGLYVGMGPLCWMVRTPGNSEGVAIS